MFRETDKDFSAPVKLLLKEMPDVILVPAYSSSAGKIIRTLRETGFKGLILGGDSWNGTGLLANCGDPGDAAFSSTLPSHSRIICKSTGILPEKSPVALNT